MHPCVGKNSAVIRKLEGVIWKLQKDYLLLLCVGAEANDKVFRTREGHSLKKAFLCYMKHKLATGVISLNIMYH